MPFFRNPDSLPPPPDFEYRPRSVLLEYKWLLITFVILLIGIVTFCYLNPPRKAVKFPSPPREDVYIQPLSQM